MPEKKNKRLFIGLVITAFLMIAVYEFLTPNMSDDIIYGDTVAKAANFFDLFSQEYEHYMNHSGRSVAHFILRVFLFMKTKSVFNVVAAAVFTCLTLLMYENIDYKRKYDISRYYKLIPDKVGLYVYMCRIALWPFRSIPRLVKKSSWKYKSK